MNSKLKTIDMEYAVAKYFDWRQNLIVPNISWGMSIHECDLLIVTNSGYCYEVEIKISKSDLKADAKKKHGHSSNMIKRLYFAIPEELSDCQDLIPDNAGIITVSSNLHCREIRLGRANFDALPLTPAERFNVARLGTMRIWSMKSAIRRSAIADNVESQKHNEGSNESN